MSDKIYANGIYFNHKREKAPEYVIGSLSLQKDRFIEWLSSQAADEKGYVRLNILEGKEKPYLTLDTWKPKQEVTYEKGIARTGEPVKGDDGVEVPFN